MFTQRNKHWAGWGGPLNGSTSRNYPESSLGLILDRGKGVTGAQENPLPPPQGLLGESDGALVGVDGSSAEDWKRFRESGLLDEKMQLRRDKEVLSGRVSELEKERDCCLHNLGLLLIEKKSWSSQMEKLNGELADAEEILKREQAAHIIAVSELEKREENLKKALCLEKQCVLDLEKALHETRSEISEAKYLSEAKLANAHSLEASLEGKHLEIESKLRAADARLAEANRKNSEIDIKFDDLEDREHKVQRELSSLNIERKEIENELSKQREHLEKWEKELMEKQSKLFDEQRLLNEREKRANDVDMIFKEKAVELEKVRKNIDATNSTLKSQECDFKERLKALTVREKDAEIKISNLEKKESDLKAIEGQLDARKQEEIQKILNEHNAILDAMKKELELEMVMKKRSFDEEIKNQFNTLSKDKKLVSVKEEQLLNREKMLATEADEIRSKEKDLDSKSNVLKNWEDILKTDEKRLQEEKKQLLDKSNEVEASRAKIHHEMLAIEAEGKKIILEKEKLKLTFEEREQHLKLQTELKMEKAEYQMMMESLEKQKEALRQEREMFEREWERLDEKSVVLEAEEKKLSAERENFEKWRHNEEERLKKQVFDSRASMQRELEDLILKKETFEKIMAQERSGACAEVDRERADMSREFELLTHGLQMTMQRKQDDAEKQFQDKKNEFERWRELELSHIKSSSESIDLKHKRLVIEENKLHREKEEFLDQRQKLEADRQEIQKDIDTLHSLCKNLKDQREEFSKEREAFLATEGKTCHNCGVPINNFGLGFQTPVGTEDSEQLLLPSLTDGLLEEDVKDRNTDMSNRGLVAGSTNSGNHMKHWLQRCANLFKIPPRKDVHPPIDQAETSFDLPLDSTALDNTALDDAQYKHRPSTSFEKPIDAVTGELDNADDYTETSFGIAGISIDTVKNLSDNGTKRTAAVTNDEIDEMEGFSMHANNDSLPEPSKQKLRRKPGRRAKSKSIRRTRSVKAVVEEAKAILGEDSELKIDEQQNSGAKDSQIIPGENQVPQVEAGQALISKRQKKRSREVEPEGSEPLSGSQSIGRRVKKPQSSSQSTAPGDKRYNLRSSTIANTAASFRGTPQHKGGNNTGILQQLLPSNLAEDRRLESNTEESFHGADESTFHDQPSGALENSETLLEKSAVHSVMEVQSANIVQHETQEVNEESATVKSTEFITHNAQDVDDVEGDNGSIMKSPELSEQIVEVDDEAVVDMPDESSGTSSDWSSGSDSEDYDEDSDKQQHTVSVGTKLWKFFTT